MRAELDRRGLSSEERRGTEKDAAQQVEDEVRSYTGVKGWLVLFAIVMALNFGWLFTRSIGTLARGGPSLPSVSLVLTLRTLVGLYGVVAAGLLFARQQRAPQHAKAALAILCTLVVGSWLYFSWKGLIQEHFPFRVLIFAGVWWAYLSASKRVRSTYSTPE